MLMTNLTKFTLWGAVVLLAAVGCQREQVADNPTYNAEKGEVTTQFVLSISTANDGPTKQSAADVQAAGVSQFRGIDEVHLLAYNLAYAPTTGDNVPHYVYKPGDASSVATRDFDLGLLVDSDDITTTHHNRVVELSLPLETNSVLFYGRAPRTKSKDEQGSVSAAGTVLNSSLSSVVFRMDNRLSDYEAFTQYAEMMSKVLTYIMRAGAYDATVARGFKVHIDAHYKFWWPQDATSKTWSTTYMDGGVQKEYTNGDVTTHPGYTFYSGEKTFKDYGTAYATYKQNPTPANALKPLEELLGEAYYNITTLVVDPGSTSSTDDDKTELRAASSPAVLRLASDLLAIINKVTSATATSYQEFIAQQVAKDIYESAKLFFTSSGTDLVYKAFEAFKASVETYIIPNPTEGTASFDATYPKVTEAFFYTGATHTGFPNNLGLPVGAAVMTFSTDTGGDLNYHKVTIETSIPAYGVGGGSLSVKNYLYPAEILYWTNSPLRTNTASIDKGAYPKTVTDWDKDSEWASTWVKYGAVKSTTQSVAVINEVNYATALMKTTVQYGAGTINDNNSGIHTNEPDNTIDVTTANRFRVSGVLIGGVDDEVGWNFLSKANSFKKFVYDNLGSASTTFAIPAYDGATASSPVYTLTWDNCNTSYLSTPGKLQDKVYVALELVNETGKDLWGELNLIRAGGTFYLVGELDPNTTAAQANLNHTTGGAVDLSRSNYQYPPYDESTGATINAVRVFMQDYVTEVNLVFGVNSLKHAYLTMPDLRASNVSLGLSVDLNWQQGLQFDNVPLGN